MEWICRREQSWKSVGSKTILNVKCKAIFSILLEEKKNFFFKAFDDRSGFCSKGEKSLRFCGGESELTTVPPFLLAPFCFPLVSWTTFAIWQVCLLKDSGTQGVRAHMAQGMGTLLQTSPPDSEGKPSWD